MGVWSDDELISGDRWEQVIKERIDGCAAFLVVLEGDVFFRLADVHAEDVRGGGMPGDRFVDALRDVGRRGQQTRGQVVQASAFGRT